MALRTNENGEVLAVCAAEVGSVLKDGDMEVADASAWTAAVSTLSKVAGTRTGGSGSLFLRVTPTLAAQEGSAYQTILTVGAKYMLNGWIRANGARVGAIHNGSTDLYLTTTNDWENFNVVFVATATTIRLCSNADGATVDTVDFDDLVLSGDQFIGWTGGSGTDDASDIDPQGYTDINGNLICRAY